MKNPFLKIILLAAALWLPAFSHAGKNILVFGDSLSAGYGIAVAESWPVLLRQTLQKSHPQFDVVNASISGETAAGGLRRIEKLLRQHQPAIVIIELGANDGLRGSRTADIEANLGEIISQVKRTRAQVLLVGMELPPNYGQAYTVQFRKIFPGLAEKHGAKLLPFLLEGVAPEQFQRDNLHPTATAQPRIMRSVLKKLEPMLR